MEKSAGKTKPTTVSSSKLGSNCWKPVRFSGGECKKVKVCPYPERSTCKAHIDAVKVIRIPTKIFAKDLPCQKP